MTDRERAIVMAYTGVSEVCMLTEDEFQIFIRYVEDIMGRPIMMHDIGRLKDEIKARSKADFMALCADQLKKGDEITRNKKLTDKLMDIARWYAMPADHFNVVKEAVKILGQNAPSSQPEYKELTPEEAASEITCGSIRSASYWLDAMIRLKEMGYVICRKKRIRDDLISRQVLKDLGAECIAKRDENGNLIPLGSIDNLPTVSCSENQNRCEDAISRQAVRDTIFAECSGTKLDIDFAKVLILQRAIKALPPVSVAEKTGRWIEDDITFCGVDFTDYKCDQCGEIGETCRKGFKPDKLPKYCPSCGIKMEVEE